MRRAAPQSRSERFTALLHHITVDLLKRSYIPKPDGSERPLSVLCLEDKIVQQAVVTVLEAIYEEDFIGFSYGFRSGRGQHDALDALHAGIYRRRVNWVRCGYPGLLRCQE